MGLCNSRPLVVCCGKSVLLSDGGKFIGIDTPATSVDSKIITQMIKLLFSYLFYSFE